MLSSRLECAKRERDVRLKTSLLHSTISINFSLTHARTHTQGEGGKCSLHFAFPLLIPQPINSCFSCVFSSPPPLSPFLLSPAHARRYFPHPKHLRNLDQLRAALQLHGERESEATRGQEQLLSPLLLLSLPPPIRTRIYHRSIA